jgi:hypothetical protein
MVRTVQSSRKSLRWRIYPILVELASQNGDWDILSTLLGLIRFFFIQSMLTIAGYIGFLVLSLGMSLALYLGLTKIELM